MLVYSTVKLSLKSLETVIQLSDLVVLFTVFEGFYKKMAA